MPQSAFSLSAFTSSMNALISFKNRSPTLTMTAAINNPARTIRMYFSTINPNQLPP